MDPSSGHPKRLGDARAACQGKPDKGCFLPTILGKTLRKIGEKNGDGLLEKEKLVGSFSEELFNWEVACQSRWELLAQ